MISTKKNENRIDFPQKPKGRFFPATLPKPIVLSPAVLPSESSFSAKEEKIIIHEPERNIFTVPEKAPLHCLSFILLGIRTPYLP